MKSLIYFSRPVYEEPPFEQREKMYVLEREKLRENITNPEQVKNYEDDIPRFNALCRGEELRVRKYSKDTIGGWVNIKL